MTTFNTVSVCRWADKPIPRKKRLNDIQERRESPSTIDLPDRSYIAPFAWAYASMLISVAPYYYRFIAVLIWASFIDR